MHSRSGPSSLPYSPECVEGVSLLKKWLSTRSAARGTPKTRPKRYHNAVFGPRTGGKTERIGVFQQCSMALAGPPRSHENGSVANAIFTPVVHGPFRATPKG